ncbi:pyruvate carboxylase [bacterium]|nr:pyruvate carboxylase [bacterium]
MNIKKVLVANRGEIAIRVFRACSEINLQTVAVYTHEDRYSLHRYKADESYLIGREDDPLKPYLDIEGLLAVAKQCGADAVHPGYGFLSENAHFARRCAEVGLIFIGPGPEAMEALGNKVKAKEVARRCGVPMIPDSRRPLDRLEIALEEAEQIGYPVILKAAAGGGGRGMRVVRTADALALSFEEARREAQSAFGDPMVFLEKYLVHPKHIEVQILADSHGNCVHLFERDCSVQRRFQKVVEMAPAWNLPSTTRERLYSYALALAAEVGYVNAGTVEFLVDPQGEPYFIEVNPRIQVEHTVTEMVTGVDLVKSQIFIAGGYRLSDEQIKIADQSAIGTEGFAIQCRITTEDPANDFKPDYGTLMTFRTGAGFGIRLDEGSAYPGMTISPFFDSLLVKVSAQSRTLDGAIRKMTRALREFRIRGVKVNIPFLINLINHDVFKEGKATVDFIAQHPEVLQFHAEQDRATKLVRFLGEIAVNGNPDVKTVDPGKILHRPKVPVFDLSATPLHGSKQRLEQLGPEGFARWLRAEKPIHYTDTTLRDAHQSLLATRMRTYDMLEVSESFGRNHPDLLSLEVWGGATFDVCLRFLTENPWRRLRQLREAVPHILFQMLLRGSNAVGYTAYPDNLIEKFIERSWVNGVDVFRIFDSLNWLESMQTSIRAVRERTGGLAEVCVCYTGDILDPSRSKFSLQYYLDKAKRIEDSGAHILGIKDMAGLLKPSAAKILIAELRKSIDMPIHLHTHDTSSLQCATYLMAIEAGVDAVDVALGGMSGLTSQPNFNALAEMMRFHERENPIDIDSLNRYSDYWETVREHYYPFESGLKAGAAEVFRHEIPGGQYSNLRPQAEALGLGDRFDEIKSKYVEVNQLFGDLVKVTPSSKVVGDMALFMLTAGLSAEDVLTQGERLSFPESVRSMFRGDLGQPDGGFPPVLQKIILKDEPAYTDLPNAHLQPLDLDEEFAEFEQKFQPGFVRSLEIEDYLSWKLYPKVFEGALDRFRMYGDVSKVPTPVFFYGLKEHEETIVEVAKGKRILVQLLSIGPADELGMRTVFFRVNGQTRNVQIRDQSLGIVVETHRKADAAQPLQLGAPLQGLLSKVWVQPGAEVKKNEALFVIEAMKMETTVAAPASGTVSEIVLREGTRVQAEDLILILA